MDYRARDGYATADDMLSALMGTVVEILADGAAFEMELCDRDGNCVQDPDPQVELGYLDGGEDGGRLDGLTVGEPDARDAIRIDGDLRCAGRGAHLDT